MEERKDRRNRSVRVLAVMALTASLAFGLGSWMAISLTAATLMLGEMTRRGAGVRRFGSRVTPIDHPRNRRPAGGI